MTTEPPRHTVDRRWPNATVVCIGTGPSLTQEDVNACRGRAKVIVVNDAYTLAPWADVLFAADQKWFKWHSKAVADFAGMKYSIEPTRWTDVVSLKNHGKHGLSLDPTGLKTGFNSIYLSIGLAVHLGAATIAILGVDMKPAGRRVHFFGEHKDGSRPPFAACLAAFETLVDPLRTAGVDIVNCTPGSALRCFPMASLASVLEVAA